MESHFGRGIGLDKVKRVQMELGMVEIRLEFH